MQGMKDFGPSSNASTSNPPSRDHLEEVELSHKISKDAHDTDSEITTDDEDEHLADRGRSTRLRSLEPRNADLQRHVSPGIGASEVPELVRVQTGRSIATNATNDPGYEIDFEEDGSDNPKEWSLAYKALTIFLVSFSTVVV